MLSIHHFISFLQTNLEVIPKICPLIVIGNFNINMLMKTYELLTLQNLMRQYNLNLYILEPITLCQIHRDHIWINAPTQQSHFGTTQTY
jgi:hypothetical protein